MFWSIIKDERGVLYFGGGEEVIEFDGSLWREIEVSNHSPVRSLAIDSLGFIYVGAVDENGCLTPDEFGNLAYNSLVAKIPDNNLRFSDVWSINIIGDKVFFQS